MKKNPSFFLMILTVSFSSCATLGSEVNTVPAEISKALSSGNTKQIIAALPEVEKLWTQEPEIYFRCLKDAAGALGNLASRNDTEARQSLAVVLDRAYQKPCPQDPLKAVSCLELKQDTLWLCCINQTAGTEKIALLALARFVGEVRSRIIANYDSESRSMPDALSSIMARSKKGMYNWKAIEEPELKKEAEQAWKDWQWDQDMRQLQSLLQRLDTNYSPKLLSRLSGYASHHPEDADFIKEVISAARLTEDERKKL